MAAPRVYTERILATFSPGTWVGWRVPAGYRAVVRSIIAIATATAGGAQVRVAGLLVYYHTFQAPQDYQIVDVRATAYAGELIEATVGLASQSIVVTAYVFEDPTGRIAKAEDFERRDALEPGQLPSPTGPVRPEEKARK